MLSQSPGIYILLSGILGTIISGIFLLISTLLNNNFQLKREKEQRNWQTENDQQKWYREKIYNCYRTSIDVLKKIIQERSEIRADNIAIDDQYRNLYPSIHNLYLDFNTEFDIIIIDYPESDSENFKEKISIIRSYMQQDPSIARLLITEMMEHDPRIKTINE